MGQKSFRWVVGVVLLLILLALPLYIGSVDQLESERTIFHDVWNRAAHTWMAVTWSGPSAADVIETEKTVLNDVWDRVGRRLRVQAIAYAASKPLTCEPGAEFYMSSVTQCLYVCNEAGIDWVPSPGCTSGPISGTTGIEVDATSVLKIRPGVTTTSTDMTLGSHFIVRVLTGGTLKTIFLGNPADPLVGGYFEVRIADVGAGTVRLAPTAGATINGISAPTDAEGGLGTITGKGSYFKIVRLSDSEWEADKMAPLP